MKIDPKKPYGTITGHPQARYIQDGQLFDTSGNSLDQRSDWQGHEEITENVIAEIEKISEGGSSRTQNARVFLQNLLAQGPVGKSSIYREAEANNQEWEVVKDAAREMGVKIFSQKSIQYWKLPEKV